MTTTVQGFRMARSDSGDDKRQAIVDFIEAYVTLERWPPTVREIGDAIGLSSSSTVQQHLRTLEREGRIERLHGCPRAIRVVQP